MKINKPFNLILFTVFALFISAIQPLKAAWPSISEKTAGMRESKGFMTSYLDEDQGRAYLVVDTTQGELLYFRGLTTGVGSNDIELDRNQMGGSHLVRFKRIGDKCLLIQRNTRYRAVSDNPLEVKAVQESFAETVIWGFKVIAVENSRILIDLTDFLMRDGHGVIPKLKKKKQGSYKIDSSRSSLYFENIKNFPQNSEFEAITTYKGTPEGEWIRSVTPDAQFITVRQRHSFIALPEPGYQPRVFDPRSGFFNIEYQDYATPISSSLKKRFIRRHRLIKKNPEAEVSEVVEPIVYYIDRGCPEPVKTALIEGAMWWAKGFEDLGYKDAFRVEEMPDHVDPMDVRYNVINWIHRSTRGWSYGYSVLDPRTGEILKGNVQLGSLRVRHDFLLAQGFIKAYAKGDQPDPRLEAMALARLRQLSAHEIGHTLGLCHNFIASTYGRASVMDYPHPFIQIKNNEIDLSEAYGVGIGIWDQRALKYGYQTFPDAKSEEVGLKAILKENEEKGYLILTDDDARYPWGAHPKTHLWDNGLSAVDDLERIYRVREFAMKRFDKGNLAPNAPLGTLENVFIPLYLSHRYQISAAAKWVGGVDYSFAAKESKTAANQPLKASEQKKALKSILKSLEPSFVEVPEKILRQLAPQPFGYERDKELFKTRTGMIFDPISAAESSLNHTLSHLLHPYRLSRLIEQRAYSKEHLSLPELFDAIQNHFRKGSDESGVRTALAKVGEHRFLQYLFGLAQSKDNHHLVSAEAHREILRQEREHMRRLNSSASGEEKSHSAFVLEQIRRFKDDPKAYGVQVEMPLPAGSPIGCNHCTF